MISLSMLPKVCDSNVFIFVEASSSLELWTPEKVSVKLLHTLITCQKYKVKEELASYSWRDPDNSDVSPLVHSSSV